MFAFCYRPSRGTISDAQAAELLSAGRHLLSQPCSVQRDSALTSVLNLLSLWRGRAATREQLSAGVNLGSAHWQIVAGAQQLAQELVTLEGHASTSTCKLPDILALLAACSLGEWRTLAAGLITTCMQCLEEDAVLAVAHAECMF
jgi:hypothetical protein